MREYDTAKMFTFLRGFRAGGDYPEITMALDFMREKHAGQTRKSSGQPYIVHPLTMTCYAISIGLKDDSLLAAILLHDVVEDTGVSVEGLPCGEKTRKAVKYMTLKELPGENKFTAKARYFTELLECRRSVIIKGLDRFDNLSTMEEMYALAEPEDKEKRERGILKNVLETHFLLLPVLKDAKEKWPDFADTFHALRYNLRALNTTLAYAHGVNLYDADYAVATRQDGVEKYLKIAPTL